ncbi:hypothetical protein JCM30471_25720 [Desulfuromonas carbonis]|uniref:sensor histidine kinase n=1 Tax=Desulfuromonas sp. DDH964 TaxID=1823759 RepID=UPI00078E7B3D|nr:ATP-binding protein [Desulfuromonas sp. DDH964]AMV70578.1 sensor histidine kinase [Desulfuromonas sp. DDH964]
MTIFMSIKGRLILAATVIMLLSALVLGGYSYQNQVRQLRHRFSDLAIHDHHLFETILQSDADGLRRALTGLSRLEPLLEPFARGDRSALLAAVQPVFTELKSQHHITHMYFISLDGEVFLRAHRPEQFGDRLERATYLRAAATRSTAHGLEMGRNFFSLRCVTPIYLHGTHIGYLEVAEEIDHIFEQMKHITGNDFGLFLPASYLESYDSALRPDAEGDFSLLYPTNRETFLLLADRLNGLLGRGLESFAVEPSRLAGQEYLIGVGPVRDAFDQTAGVLVTQRNITLLHDALWRGVVSSLAGFVAILVVGNALLYLSMRKSLNLFQSLHQHIRNVTQSWDSKARLQIDTRDEIGELATDLNRLQDEMQKMQTSLQQRASELAAANQELEAFGYSLSHDLRTPLAKIASAAEILRENYAASVDEDGQFLLTTICAGSEQMDRLIEAIMVLTKSTRKELALETVDLAALAREVAADCADTDPEERRVEFIAPDQVLVQGDTQLLRPVLSNLLENAWKYTREQSAPRVEFGVEERSGKQVFFVRDNGIGFDMHEAGKLFQPFQRLNNASGFAGTGIGLATVQKIVQRHGGRVWAKGKLGQGATFFFTLS